MTLNALNAININVWNTCSHGEVSGVPRHRYIWNECASLPFHTHAPTTRITWSVPLHNISLPHHILVSLIMIERLQQVCHDRSLARMLLRSSSWSYILTIQQLRYFCFIDPYSIPRKCRLFCLQLMQWRLYPPQGLTCMCHSSNGYIALTAKFLDDGKM